MICLRARPLFSTQITHTFSKTKHSQINLRLLPRRSFSTVSSVTMSQSPIIEHIVLFKIKPETDSTKINSMLDNLNALISLDQVIHLSAAPLLRSTSPFTHILHSRYGSNEDLSSYGTHPDHVRVVKESVLPICDDIMAVDWISDKILPGTLASPSPGSVGKISFIKVKENVSDEVKFEIIEVIKGLNEKFPGINQITVGDNFSPARAKGYSIASIAFFKDLSEMESVDSQKDLINLEKDKVRDYVDSTIVAEFVVPSSSSQASNL